MTVGDIKLATLRKMFANDTAITTTDLPQLYDRDEYIVYLNAMPDCMNEAISILTAVKPIIKSYEITSATPRSEINGTFVYRLNDIIPDFRRINSIKTNKSYSVEGENILTVPELDRYMVYYESTPTRITVETPDNYELTIPNDMQVLIPSYVAGEIYKDDDNSIAVQFLNEFWEAMKTLRLTSPAPFIQVENVYGGEVIF